MRYDYNQRRQCTFHFVRRNGGFMADIIMLGTGAALSGPTRENTFMVIRGARSNILIDCAGSPTQRLAHVGLSPAEIGHVILTHDHPDHIYGWPMFALNAWMDGRRTALHVYGLQPTLTAARRLISAVGLNELPAFFPIAYHRVRPASAVALPSIDEFDLIATPTIHFVPTIALRVTNRASGQSIAYTADTSPDPAVVELARGARYFIHEATTLDESSAGHSSAVEAGMEAQAARVQDLVLVHLPPAVNPQKWRAAARRSFRGPVTVANDFDCFEF
jgi:ribonuclease Z